MPTEAAISTVRTYFDRLLNDRDLSACDDLLAADYVDHDAPPDTPPGPAATKEFISAFLAQYPDLHVELEDLAAEADRVTLRAVWSGTDARSARPYRESGLVTVRLNEHGQLAERWSEYAPPERDAAGEAVTR